MSEPSTPMPPAAASVPPLTPALAIVQRWVNALGMSTRPIAGTGPDGTQVSGLEIHRGQSVIVAFSPSSSEQFVILKMVANLPAALRATIGKLGDDSRRQLTEAVFVALQSNPRSGYQVTPPGVPDLSQIQQISLEQVVMIAEEDPGTFNRLADAIQELVTGFTIVGRQIAVYVSGTAVEASSRLRQDSPRDMFR